MTRKNTWARLAVAVVLCLPLTACKDTKTLQENEQLKAQVAELHDCCSRCVDARERETQGRDQDSETKALRNESGESKTPPELNVPIVLGAARSAERVNRFLFILSEKGGMENENV